MCPEYDLCGGIHEYIDEDDRFMVEGRETDSDGEEEEEEEEYDDDD
jgi:hypothetical protein